MKSEAVLELNMKLKLEIYQASVIPRVEFESQHHCRKRGTREKRRKRKRRRRRKRKNLNRL